jgi:mRNA interferase MazF
MLIRGEVYVFDLDPVVGSEQSRRRPCVVVQRDSANRTSPTTIVCPISTATTGSGTLLRVYLAKGSANVSRDSFILCNQVRIVDNQRIRSPRIGTVDAATMALVDRGLRAILDLQGAPIDAQ